MCELLSVLCSPDMNAVEQLEMKQVGASKGEMGGGGNGREKEEGGRGIGERWGVGEWEREGGRRERDGREIGERWVTGLYELLSVLCSPDTNAAQHLEMNQVWRVGGRNEHGEGGRERGIKERKGGGGGFREGGNEFLRTVGCVCMLIRVYINLYSLTPCITHKTYYACTYYTVTSWPAVATWPLYL